MNVSDIVQLRLHNQQITGTQLKTPTEMVAWLGAVQAQDFAAAKWALGLRLPHSTNATIEQAMADGKILRTHVMRPTWHFVAPKDIRWMLELTAPRIKMLAATNEKKLGLTEAIFKKTNKLIVQSLNGGKQLTRTEIIAVFEKAKIATDEYRSGHIMMRAELDGLICSGARKGKQFTYALLDDVVPHTKPLKRDEALAELARRYFTSHGPATLHDFSWWSGLTLTDARNGIEALKPMFVSETVDGKEYWMKHDILAIKKSSSIYLLPAFDEYTIAYRDRTAFIDPNNTTISRNGIFYPTIVSDGKIIGTWKRMVKGKIGAVETDIFGKMSKSKSSKLNSIIKQYNKFINTPLA